MMENKGRELFDANAEADADAIRRFVIDAIKNPATSKRTIIGYVSETARALIEEALERPISARFRHVLTGDGVRHTLAQHGNDKRESQRGLVAITVADFLMIPEIVAAPDTVTKGGETRQNRLETLIYSKRINGETVYVEEARSGREELATKTFYRKKTSVSPVPNVQNVTPGIPEGVNAETAVGKRLPAELNPVKENFVQQRLQGQRPPASANTALVINENRRLSEPLTDDEIRRRMSSHTRRGFIVGGVAALAGFFGWRFISEETKAELYRRSFYFNERVSQIFYRPTRLAPEFPIASISPPRVNGMEGMQGEIDLSAWRLAVGGLADRADDLILTLDDIKRLPRVEMTTELKCIEGWSVIVNWAGTRFSDFAAAYLPKTINGSQPDVANRPAELLPYVSITTPDDGYFVAWDMPSMLHPQTLLAYEMNGEPLRPEHGAPLRIASPTKYGIKQIKRIGRIEFTSERPRDFWAESGYDWYSGH